MKKSVLPRQVGERRAADREHIILAGLIAGLAIAVDDEEDRAGKVAGVGREPDRLTGAEPAERRGEIVVEAVAAESVPPVDRRGEAADRARPGRSGRAPRRNRRSCRSRRRSNRWRRDSRTCRAPPPPASDVRALIAEDAVVAGAADEHVASRGRRRR